MAIKKVYAELLQDNERLRVALWRLHILARNEISLDPPFMYLENLVNYLNDEEQLFSDPEITDDLIVELTTSPEMTMMLVIESMLDEIAGVLDGKEDSEEIAFRATLITLAQNLGYEGISFDGYPAISTVAEIKEAVREAREKLASQEQNEATGH